MALTYTWNAPREWASGEIVTAVNMNTYLSALIGYLKGLGGAPTIEVSSASTAVAVEIQRLLATSTGTSAADFGPRLAFAYDDDTDSETEIGSLDFLRVSSGNSKAVLRYLESASFQSWHLLPYHKYSTSNTSTNTTSTSYVDINSNSLTLDRDGTWIVYFSARFGDGGTGGDQAVATISVGGTDKNNPNVSNLNSSTGSTIYELLVSGSTTIQARGKSTAGVNIAFNESTIFALHLSPT